MTNDKCPKCGAGATRDPIEAKPTRWMSCDSEFDCSGGFHQSALCRIRELEADNAALKRLNEDLAERVAKQSDLLSKRAEKGA